MKTTVIYHSADFDGIFCREIARKFVPDAQLIGWDYGDTVPEMPDDLDMLYMLDISIEALMNHPKLVWIDHHKSAMEKFHHGIPGYRIDGVAACRLAYQWLSLSSKALAGEFDFEKCMTYFGIARFTDGVEPHNNNSKLPTKQDFIDRLVTEPWAVRLAGEYDIWDKRDPDAELFQHGLKSCDLSNDWGMLLSLETKTSFDEIESLIMVGHRDILRPDGTRKNPTVVGLLDSAKVIQYVREQEYRAVITEQGFDMEFEGLKFLACCSHELDIRSHLFAAGIQPHHDALFGFTYTGKDWRVSLYHAPGKEHHDLSLIAVKYCGGGHRGACGFRVKKLPLGA